MNYTVRDIDRIIEMAWEDRTPFEAIEFQFGLKENDVMQILNIECKDLLINLKKQPVIKGKPKAIIAHTIKGKGIISSETSSAWHHKAKITKLSSIAIWVSCTCCISRCL